MSTKVNIGSLIVSVLANTLGFETGINKSGKKLKVFEKQLEQGKLAISTFNKAFAGIAAGVTVGALAVKFKSAAESLDNLAKTSAKIGIASEKLVAFRFAGEQTGVAVQTMDNAFTKLTMRISEASKGMGEAKDVLKELELDVKKLKEMTPDKQFYAIAKAMEGVTNHSDKLRIATKLFEEEGMALVNTLALGEEGLKQMEEQARKLGIAFSKEDLARVEAFNDAWNELSKAAGSLGQQFVVDVSPAAAAFAKSLGESVEGLRLERNAKQQTLTGKSASFFGDILSGNTGIQKAISDRMIRRQIKRGVAAGTAAPNMIQEFGVRGVPLAMIQHPGFDQKKLDEVIKNVPLGEHNLGKQKAFDHYIRKGLREVENVAAKVPGLFKEAGKVRRDLEKGASAWQRQWFKNQLLGPKLQLPRKEVKEQSRTLNEALVKGTVEAAVAARAKDTVPQQQLVEARKQTGILEKIAASSGIHLMEVGLN